MDLMFRNRHLARLCNEEDQLVAWAGGDAFALQQLLNEIDCADRLGRVEELPHVSLLRAPAGRVAAHGADDAGVLLDPELGRSRAFRDAEAATVLAVAIRDEHFNPEGAAWPRAFALSRTTR
jgi:hypothetical protein